MAFNHPKSFATALLLMTNLSILLSFNTSLAKARHLLETTLPELPDQPELPGLPNLSTFPLPELPAGLPKFEFPPLPFIPRFPELPTVSKDHLPSFPKPHSAPINP